MRAHIIKGGVVANTVEVANLDAARGLFPDAVVIEATQGGIRWLWDGVTLSQPPAPPEPVPEAITPLQARRALRAADLLDAVNAWIATQPDDAQEAWEYCIEVRRDSPLIAGAQEGLGLTPEQVDDLFRAGAAL